ncbi:MAG: preprotein translocase subunit SecE [Planctomycetota bacterium]|jgi:preprotein translocase SecE subunit
MAVGIYKKGQGYWTRVMSAIAMGMLVLMGAVWLADHLKNVRIGGLEPIYTQAVTFVLVFAGFFWLGYYLIGYKPKVVDFLIATESEMKKVNWSSRREIRGSTLVVIGLTLVVALIIAVLDYVIYTPLFKWVNVLETAS